MTTNNPNPSPLFKVFLTCSFTLPSSSSNDVGIELPAGNSKNSLLSKISKKISETAEKVQSSASAFEKYQCRAVRSVDDTEISRSEENKNNPTGVLNFHLPLFLGVDHTLDVVRIMLFKNNKRIFSYAFDPSHMISNDSTDAVLITYGNESDLTSIQFRGQLIRRKFFAQLFRPGWSLTDPVPDHCHYSSSASCKSDENTNETIPNQFSLLDINGNLKDSGLSGKFYNYPLFCTYAFRKDNKEMTATERTVESSIVLPLAAATLKSMCSSFLTQQETSSVIHANEVTILIQLELIQFIRSCPGGGATLVLYETKEYLYGHELWRGNGETLAPETSLKVKTGATHLLITLHSRSNPPEIVMGTIDLTKLSPGSQSNIIPVKMFSPSQQVGVINLNISTRTVDVYKSKLVSHKFLNREEMGDVGNQWLTAYNAKQTDAFDDLKRLSEFYRSPQPINFNIETNKRHEISAFRPSSSKSIPLLRCIPINTHSHSFVVEDLNGQQSQLQPKYFHAITTGVPSDHFLSFRDGGLDKLFEQHSIIKQQIRQEMYQTRFVTPFTNSSEFSACAEQRSLCRQLIELTHHINLRKMHILPGFIAQLLTVYLGDLSNVAKVKENINRWVAHGYIVCMEGLLSSFGKELGMIQDCFGMIMELNKTNLKAELVCGNSNESNPAYVPVQGSECIAGVSVTIQPDCFIAKVHMKQKYFSYYSFMHNRQIVILPLLFQVGVDIQQWGSNTIQNVKNSNVGKKVEKDASSMSDPKILSKVNSYSFQVLNRHCHRLFPTESSVLCIPQINLLDSINPVFVHPLCTPLFQLVDPGNVEKQKIEHSIFHYASRISQQCGAGSLIFCKSGKDRTGMQVTYQQSQVLDDRSFEHINAGSSINNLRGIMRLHGTRIFICEKNIGTPKYAFNSLQLQFMPEVLRPPTGAIAGVLKGGAVFRGEGMVES